MRPWPPSFSLANTKTVSPAVISLPPYIVLCAANANVLARRSTTFALIANTMIVLDRGTSRNPTTDHEWQPRGAQLGDATVGFGRFGARCCATTRLGRVIRAGGSLLAGRG